MDGGNEDSKVPGTSRRKVEFKEEEEEAFVALKALENAVVDDDLALQQDIIDESEQGMDQLIVGNIDDKPVEEGGLCSESYFPFGEMNFSDTSGSTYNPSGMLLVITDKYI